MKHSPETVNCPSPRIAKKGASHFLARWEEDNGNPKGCNVNSRGCNPRFRQQDPATLKGSNPPPAQSSSGPFRAVGGVGGFPWVDTHAYSS